MNYIKRKAKIYERRLKIYATSVAGSTEKEGAEASTTGALEEGAEGPVAVVEEVAGGRIRDTNLGAYSFAFLKNSVISTKGTTYEAPTFSQSTSSPCDWARAIAPSTPHFTDMRFTAQT
jgi:hypothetical protein